MKVEQHPYLSPEAMTLRRRDGTKPWGVHVCEVDALAHWTPDGTAFYAALIEARRLRERIEAEG